VGADHLPGADRVVVAVDPLVPAGAPPGMAEPVETKRAGWPNRAYRLTGGVNLDGETSPGGET